MFKNAINFFAAVFFFLQILVIKTQHCTANPGKIAYPDLDPSCFMTENFCTVKVRGDAARGAHVQRLEGRMEEGSLSQETVFYMMSQSVAAKIVRFFMSGWVADSILFGVINMVYCV